MQPQSSHSGSHVLCMQDSEQLLDKGFQSCSGMDPEVSGRPEWWWQWRLWVAEKARLRFWSGRTEVPFTEGMPKAGDCQVGDGDGSRSHGFATVRMRVACWEVVKIFKVDFRKCQSKWKRCKNLRWTGEKWVIGLHRCLDWKGTGVALMRPRWFD